MLRSFRTHIILRLALIIALTTTGIYVLFETYFWLVSIWLFLFAIITTYSLIRKVEKHKRELFNFLMSISQNDYSNTHKATAPSALDEDLHYAYNTISATMQHLRTESETNSQFLKTVVEHSTIAMIAYWEDNEEVILINASAKQLFDKPHLKQLKALTLVDQSLYNAVKQLESEQQSLIKMMKQGKVINLSVSAREIKLSEKLLKLVSFQNINAELDEKELESWQKLIRVLTHEIKNSAIPISTLTEVINQLILTDDGKLKDLSQLDQEDLEDLKLGVHTVQKRSKGLVRFVNAYGELAKVPAPQLAPVDMAELVNGIITLMADDLSRQEIAWQVHVVPTIVQMDAELIEQVLINMLKNAKEALTNVTTATIVIRSFTDNGQTILVITDNGPGIDQETMDQIFVPFFTTKKEGSGIGLSLSRQIMRAHGGNLTVASQPGNGTQVHLIF